MEFTHLDKNGNAKMVDVSLKDVTVREAVAIGKVFMKADTLKMIKDSTIPKGDVAATARIAGIMAAKRTGDLIPMCHNIPIDSVKVDIKYDHDENCVCLKAAAKCTWKTGIEMEVLTAVSVAALTIYDMCKAVDKTMVIKDIKLIKKTGGKSGDYIREE